MRTYLKHSAIVLLALLLIAAGVLGLVLPVLPGLLLILVGMLLLAAYNAQFEAWLHTQTRRYPPLHQAALDLQAFIERILGKR